MKPLEGITVLDLSRVLACPFASMILAELGATVIKVEQPGSGDETRSFEPQVSGPGGSESAYFLAFNRSKQSITVNLRKPAGQALIRQLAQQADVLLENFPVGTLARYGLDYPALSALCPRLVYLSCTGFGQSGPYAPRKGYDTVFQAMGGLMSLTGEKGGRPGAAAMSISPCSMARSPCSAWPQHAGSPWAKCRRARSAPVRSAPTADRSPPTARSSDRPPADRA